MLGFTFCGVHSMGFVKHTMTGIHYYNIVQNSFIALKILCSSYLSLPSFPKFPNLFTDLFTEFLVIAYLRMSYS